MTRWRWKSTLLMVAACLVSAGTGFWFGFREALPLGLAAETLPRGVLATKHLQVLRSGHSDVMVTYLEYDVDRGLVSGYDVLNHPLRTLFLPLWRYDAYPKYEKYAVQLADYRKKHPSPTWSEEFKTLLREFEEDKTKYGEFTENARIYQLRLKAMTERYGSKP
jgi:hypothetical protein